MLRDTRDMRDMLDERIRCGAVALAPVEGDELRAKGSCFEVDRPCYGPRP